MKGWQASGGNPLEDELPEESVGDAHVTPMFQPPPQRRIERRQDVKNHQFARQRADPGGKGPAQKTCQDPVDCLAYDCATASAGQRQLDVGIPCYMLEQCPAGVPWLVQLMGDFALEPVSDSNELCSQPLEAAL
jgi:hypothetical protein